MESKNKLVTLKHIRVINVTAACLLGTSAHKSLFASIQILPELTTKNKRQLIHRSEVFGARRSETDTLYAIDVSLS